MNFNPTTGQLTKVKKNNSGIDISKIKAVIFDMDGVLADTEPVYYKVEQKLFKSLGLNITPEIHHTFVGMSMKLIWEKIKETNYLDLSDEELINLHKKLMIRGIKTSTNLQPVNGIIPLLQFLIENNIEIAVASSSSHKLINVILTSIGIKKYFPLIISGDDVPVGKPAPDIFLRTLEELKICAENAVVVEDSTNGIFASKEAGIPCIAYKNPNSGNQVLDKADMIITDFEKFHNYLKKEFPVNKVV